MQAAATPIFPPPTFEEPERKAQQSIPIQPNQMQEMQKLREIQDNKVKAAAALLRPDGGVGVPLPVPHPLPLPLPLPLPIGVGVGVNANTDPTPAQAAMANNKNGTPNVTPKKQNIVDNNNFTTSPTSPTSNPTPQQQKQAALAEKNTKKEAFAFQAKQKQQAKGEKVAVQSVEEKRASAMAKLQAQQLEQQ